MEERFSLEVDGQEIEVTAAPDTPLLWVLREHGWTGTRYGCGAGLCGACTVWLDGQPVHSCDTPIWSVGSASVTTARGLGDDGPHPVQAALINAQAGQCGFCLSGIVMRAAALVDREGSTLTEDRIRAELDGHLCRCGVHPRIIAAVLQAAQSGDNP